MIHFKFSVPIIGKIIAYIYDFATYKTKFNIKCDFFNIRFENNFYFFTLQITNKTSYNIEIQDIYPQNQLNSIEIGNQNINDEGLICYEYQKINQTYQLLPFELKDKYNNYINALEVKYKGNQDVLYIKYQIKDIKTSLFHNNIRIVKFVSPL